MSRVVVRLVMCDDLSAGACAARLSLPDALDPPAVRAALIERGWSADDHGERCPRHVKTIIESINSDLAVDQIGS